MDELKVMSAPMKPMKTSNQCPYSCLELETVNNGYEVCYYEKVPSRGEYDHVESVKKEFVFAANDFDKAVKKYKEISDCIMEYSNM